MRGAGGDQNAQKMKPKAARFLRFWFPVLVYSGIIFTVSSFEHVPIRTAHQADKLLHLLEYMPFGFLVARALAKTILGAHGKRRWLIYAVFATFLYALSDEWHQSFVIGREADIIDVIADTLGGLMGAGIYIIINPGKSANRDVGA